MKKVFHRKQKTKSEKGENLEICFDNNQTINIFCIC